MSRYLTPAKIGLLILIELYCENHVPPECCMDVLAFLTGHLVDSDVLTPALSRFGLPEPAAGYLPAGKTGQKQMGGGGGAGGVGRRDIKGEGEEPRANARWRRAEATVSLIVSVRDFRRLLDREFTLSTPIESTVGGLHGSGGGQAKVPREEKPVGTGRLLWEGFLERLWGVDSLHAMHEFFWKLKRFTKIAGDDGKTTDATAEEEGARTPIQLSPNSPFGSFVRRCHVEFARLRFHDSCRLWKDLVKYRQETLPEFKKVCVARQRVGDVAAMGKLGWDSALVNGGFGKEGMQGLAVIAYGDVMAGGRELGGCGLPVSTDDVGRLLEFQVEQLQTYGTRLPTELRHQLSDLLSDSPMIPSLTHYVSFLDSWRSGDYPSSFDHLHRYFDYTIQSRGDRPFYHYALLNLAVLQCDFGCFREALAAMLEAVSTARENRDVNCLNFTLNWLYQFGKTHPKLVREVSVTAGDSSSGAGSGDMAGPGGAGVGGTAGSGGAPSGGSHASAKESLAFLRDRARDAETWTLWSGALWSEVRLLLEQGESIATATELLARSSHNIVDHGLTAAFGSQIQLCMWVWQRLGVTSLSKVGGEVFARCYLDGAGGEDRVGIACVVAVMCCARGDWAGAERVLGAEGGVVDENVLRGYRGRGAWGRMRMLVGVRRDLCAGRMEEAGRGVERLLGRISTNWVGGREGGSDVAVEAIGEVLASKAGAASERDSGRRGLGRAYEDDDEVLDPLISTQNHLVHVEYLIAKRDLQAAFAKVNYILSASSAPTSSAAADTSGRTANPTTTIADCDISTKITFLLLKSRLYALAGKPSKGFSTAVKATGMAWQARLMTQLWYGIASVATVLVAGLGEFGAAAELVEAVLPRAMETGDAKLVGELFGILGDAEVGGGGRAGWGPGGRPARRTGVGRGRGGFGRGGGRGGTGDTLKPDPNIWNHASSLHRKERLERGLWAFGEAAKYWGELGDVKVKGEMLAKMATIGRVLGGGDVGMKWAREYVALKASNTSQNQGVRG